MPEYIHTVVALLLCALFLVVGVALGIVLHACYGEPDA
jgi:hypothetical protein